MQSRASARYLPLKQNRSSDMKIKTKVRGGPAIDIIGTGGGGGRGCG